MKTMTKILRPMLAAPMWLPFVLGAQAKPPAGTPTGTAAGSLAVTAENLMAGDSVHRALARTGQSPTSLLPGDEMRFQLKFTNTTQGSVKNVRFANPVPARLRVIGSSARSSRSDVNVEYSIDGGKSFSAQPTIEVVEGGKPVRRPAPAERYTDLRWVVAGSLPAGSNVVAEYRASLRGGTVVERGGGK